MQYLVYNISMGASEPEPALFNYSALRTSDCSCVNLGIFYKAGRHWLWEGNGMRRIIVLVSLMVFISISHAQSPLDAPSPPSFQTPPPMQNLTLTPMSP